ncbi:beta-lactamase-like protein, partial [Phakopsora pachyrhizi]
IVRILGQNPGPFTLQGTNTYLIHGDRSSILIDTGEGLNDYSSLLESQLRKLEDRPIEDIILTHWHNDHAGGLESVLNSIFNLRKNLRLPRIWKFKLATDDGLIDDRDRKIVNSIENFKSRRSVEDFSLEWLIEGKEFELDDRLKVRTIRTPGHTQDSCCCLVLEKHQDTSYPSVDQNYTHQPFRLSSILVGDTLLGGSTTIFEDLKTYLDTLKYLSSLIKQSPPQPLLLSQSPSSDVESKRDSDNGYLNKGTTVEFYPGHGEVIEDGKAEIQKIILHRIERENQIVKLLSNTKILESDGSLSLDRIVLEIYGEKLIRSDERLRIAATRGINQHLEKLRIEGIVIEVRPGHWKLL